MTKGIKPANPVTIILIAATMAVAPIVPIPANAKRPEAIAASPAPATANDAANASAPAPINAKEAPNANNAGIAPDKAYPAIPITANAPASATSPLAIPSQLMALRAMITGVSIISAAAAITNAADPATVPDIAYNPAARIIIDPDMATSPLAIPSQLMPPNNLNTGTNIKSAAAAKINDPDAPAVPFMAFRPTARTVKAPPIANKPFATSLKLIPDILFKTPAKIIRAVDAIISPKPRLIVLSGRAFNANVMAAKAPAIPNKPIPNDSRFMFPKSEQAEAIILIAADNSIILKAPFAISPVFLLIRDTAPKSTPVAPTSPPRPISIWSQDNSPIFFKAPAIIDIEIDIVIMVAQAFNTPLDFLFISLNTAIDPIKSANKPVTTPSVTANFSLSTKDNAIKEAASMAIDPAIFNNVLDFICC